jgi:hypothetical protein
MDGNNAGVYSQSAAGLCLRKCLQDCHDGEGNGALYLCILGVMDHPQTADLGASVSGYGSSYPMKEAFERLQSVRHSNLLVPGENQQALCGGSPVLMGGICYR